MENKYLNIYVHGTKAEIACQLADLITELRESTDEEISNYETPGLEITSYGDCKNQPQ